MSFSYKSIFTEVKKHDFCDAFAIVQTHHKMLSLPRLLTPPSPRHKMLRLPRKCKMHEQKALHLPRENDTLALTRVQSIAPVTQNAKMTSHLVTLKRQNEHFVRDFQLRIDDFMRVFLIKLFSQSSKSMIFCEASATFQGSHQMLRLPRLLTLCHVCAALTPRFMAKALWTRHKMLRLPRKCKTPHCKALRLPRENDTLALTRVQSIAPVTQNAKMTSHLVTLKRQNEHFVRDFLQISYVRRNLPKHLRKLSRMAVN